MVSSDGAPVSRARTGTLIFRRTAGYCAQVWATEPDGTERRRFFRLGTFDKDLAKRKMAKIVDGLASGELVVDTAKVEVAKAETIAQYADAWLKRREAAGVVWVDDERRHLESFVLPDFGALTMAEFRSRDARAVLAAMVEDGYAKATVTKVRGTLFRLFDAAWKAELDGVRENPVARVDVPTEAKVDGRERAILTDTEIAQFFACTKVDMELRVVAACSRILGGMRTAETIRWDWSTIDTTHFAQVSYQRAKAKRGTGGKLQRLAVPETLRGILRGWWEAHGKPSAGPVFPVRSGANEGGFKSSTTSFAKRLRAGLLVAGVTRHELHNDTPTSKRVDHHSFRRAFATALAEGGTNVQQAMKLTGHSDGKTHALYVASSAAMREIPAAAVPQLQQPVAFAGGAS